MPSSRSSGKASKKDWLPDCELTPFLRLDRLKPAYATALSLIRPFGVISSVGVHNDPCLLSGPDTYDLNLRASFGRCPVRGEFAEALEILRAKKDLFMGDGKGSGFVSDWMHLEDAPEVSLTHPFVC